MSSVEILIPILNITVQFYVGKNASQNSDIVKMANDEDLWFHVEGHPSCHVIAIMPSDVDRKKIRYIVKQGAVLCKQHSKFSSNRQVGIVYAYIKDVTPTNTAGLVLVNGGKIIYV